MTNNTFKYSLKIWLTSVLLSPVLFALILYIKRQIDLPELLKSSFYLLAIYALYVGALFIFSSVTWLAFWLCIRAIIKRVGFRKMAVIFTGITLTIVTFMLLLPALGMLNDGSGFTNLMYANCLCISWGAWYYDLGPLIS